MAQGRAPKRGLSKWCIPQVTVLSCAVGVAKRASGEIPAVTNVAKLSLAKFQARKISSLLAGVLLHHLHQVDGASNVVFEVHDGVFHGLPDCLLGCKMHDALDRLPAVFLGLENCLELANVHNVHFMELDT